MPKPQPGAMPACPWLKPGPKPHLRPQHKRSRSLWNPMLPGPAQGLRPCPNSLPCEPAPHQRLFPRLWRWSRYRGARQVDQEAGVVVDTGKVAALLPGVPAGEPAGRSRRRGVSNPRYRRRAPLTLTLFICASRSSFRHAGSAGGTLPGRSASQVSPGRRCLFASLLYCRPMKPRQGWRRGASPARASVFRIPRAGRCRSSPRSSPPNVGLRSRYPASSVIQRSCWWLCRFTVPLSFSTRRSSETVRFNSGPLRSGARLVRGRP